MPSSPHITRLGLPGIDRVPFGMHACHFYSSRDQLVAALVPYIVTGLGANERCLWITAPPLPAREAVATLRGAWEGTDDAVASGALRVLDFHEWYATTSGLKGAELVQTWLAEEEQALAAGYSGLRIAGNASFLKPGELATFMKYEESVTAGFNGRRIVALCSYPRAACSDLERSQVMHAHHCALEGPDSDWHVFAVPQTPATLRRVNGHSGHAGNGAAAALRARR